MRILPLSFTHAIYAAALGGLILPGLVRAAVVTNPTLTTGADAIDPAGSQTIDQTPGVLAEGSLEGHLDFRGAIQDLGVGFDNYLTNPINIVNFTDPTLADIRFTIGGTSVNDSAGINISNSSRVTSGTTGLQFLQRSGSSASATVTMLIEFGNYDTGTSTFTTGATVDAVGFVIGNIRTTMKFDVVFRDSFGLALTPTQTLTGVADSNNSDTGSADGADAFFSYGGDGTLAKSVGSIFITRTGGVNIGSAFDDFGFTSLLVVPEPSTAAMLLGGCGMLGLVRRRRRRA